MSKEFYKTVLIIICLILVLFFLNRIYLVIAGSLGTILCLIISHLIVFGVGYFLGRRAMKKKLKETESK